MSINRKLTLIMMVTSAAALLLACVSFVAHDLITFRREMARDLSAMAAVIGDNCTAALAFEDQPHAEETLAALRPHQHIVAGCVYRLDGSVFATFVRPEIEGSFVPPQPEPAAQRFTSEYIEMFSPIVLDGETIGTIYLQSDLEEMNARLDRYAGIAGIVLAASSLVAFLISWRLKRVITTPILNLANTARNVSADRNYSLRAASHASDEVGLLTDSFNQMLDQIEERDATLVRAQAGLEARVQERTRELLKEINERSRAEEAVRRSAEHCRALVENISDIISILDADGTIVYESPSCERLLGYTPDQLIGRSAFDLVHPEDLPAILEAFARSTHRPGSLKTVECRYRHADGTWRHFEAIWNNLLDNPAVRGIIVNSRDITARRQAESEIVLQKTRFQQLMENSPVGIAMLDHHDRILLVNEAFEAIFQFSQDELVGRQINDVIVPDEYKEEAGGLSRKTLQGLNVETTSVRQRKDGSLVDVQIYGVPIIVDGKPAGFYGIYVDITEIRRAMDALRENQNRLSLIYNTTADPMWLVEAEPDDRYRFISVNKALLQVTGFSEDQVIGRHIEELLPHSSDPAVREKYAEAKRTRKSTRFRRELADLPSGRRVGEITVTPIVDRSGVTTHILGVAFDRTDQERAEEARRKSETQYKNLFENANDALLIFEPGGETIVEVNSKACEIYGFTKEEFLRKSFKDLTKDIPRGEHEVRQLLADGSHKNFETVHFRKDGSEVEIMANSSVIEYEGRTAILTINRDMTARKQAERELKKAKDVAEAANRAKSEFLAAMSHEIRTPINGVIGMTDLVLDTKLSPEQREYLMAAKSSSESLLDVIDDILDFSRIEAGKLYIEPVGFALKDWLETTMMPLTVRAMEKGLDLSYDLKPDVPDAIIGDAGRLRQVLVNLVSNAIKFTEEGRVVVEVGKESETDGEARLRFSISDTGVGIPPDKQIAIFRPFTQADSSVSRKYGGTGLGLSIASKLLEMMDGRIWVESPPASGGPGSTFHFEVRFGLQNGASSATRAAAVRAPAAQAVGSSARTPTVRPARVLLAEDNEINQKVVTALLKKRGHTVTVAGNGIKALDALQRERFDIVLMDVQMPEMDGLEATAAIRAIEQASGAHIPIVALTAHAIKGDRERCLAAGMDGYVSKPVRAEDLFQAIEGLTFAAREANAGAEASLEDVLDRSAAFAQVGGDMELFREIVAIFLETYPELLAHISDAVTRADGEALLRAAHTLKGSVGNFHAKPAFEAAFRLERMGRASEFGGAADAVESLEREMERVKRAITELTAEMPV